MTGHVVVCIWEGGRGVKPQGQIVWDVSTAQFQPPLTPTPQLALSGHQQTVCSTGTRYHTANLDIIQTSVAVRTPQILAKVAESSWRQTNLSFKGDMYTCKNMKDVTKISISYHNTLVTSPQYNIYCNIKTYHAIFFVCPSLFLIMGEPKCFHTLDLKAAIACLFHFNLTFQTLFVSLFYIHAHLP